jgi:hypothetical protein
MSLYNQIMNIDPAKLEAERFGLSQDCAREMLTKAGTIRKRAKKVARPKTTRAKITEKKSQPKRESITKKLDLSEAQQRAVENWLKGLG